MRIAILLAALASGASAFAQLSRLEYTPHLLQKGFGPNGEYLPNDGSEYCVPTSFTMAMYWLRANGLERLAPPLTRQNALDADLSLAGFLQTTPDGGTDWNSASGFRAKISAYLRLKGIANVGLEYVEKPDLSDIQEAVSGRNIGVINLVWVNTSTHERMGGHDVVPVAAGIDAQGQPAPDDVAINNPMRAETQFLPTERLSDYGVFSSYLAFAPGSLGKPGQIAVIDNLTILEPVLFHSPLTAFQPARDLHLAAIGGTMNIFAPVIGARGVTKSGAGAVVFGPSSHGTYRGATRLFGGEIVTRQAHGPVLGRGDIRLIAGSVALAPSGGGRAALLLGAKGRRFDFAGGTISLRRERNESLVARIAGVFRRDFLGSLVIAPSHGLDALGRTESLVLDGGADEGLIDASGRVAPAIFGLNLDGTGEFLRYDANRGFVRAAAGAIRADEEVPAGRTLDATALRVERAAVSGGGTLRLTGGVAGLILNGSAVQTEALRLDAKENLVFVGRGNGRIPARVEGSGALVVTGPGALRLGAENDYSGPTTIRGATLVVANASGSATGAGPVLVQADAVLTGAGRVGGSLQVAGTLWPGGRTGRLKVGGDVEFANRSTFDWTLGDLRDGAWNEKSPWGLLEAEGGLTFSNWGSQFEILRLHFPARKSPNRSLAFWRQPHRWVIARAAGVLDATGLAIQNPRFTAGQFSLRATARQLVLVYAPAAL